MTVTEKEINKELEQLKELTRVNKFYRYMGWGAIFVLTYTGTLDLIAFLKFLIGWHALEFIYTLICYFDTIKKLYFRD